MSEATDRFSLPFILPGQAQKELFHNEALARIDAVVSPALEDLPVAEPPAEAEPGQSWVVAAGATGPWAGKADQIACLTDGGWRFVAPQPGMLAWVKPLELWLLWNGSVWLEGALPASALIISGEQVVGPRQPAVPPPSGGSVIDVEARAAIEAVIATLMQHGLTD